MRMRFLIGWLIAALILTGCSVLTMPVTATEDALCRAWGSSLPTRSHSDTAQTQTEIGAAYADFAAACPGHSDLVP